MNNLEEKDNIYNKEENDQEELIAIIDEGKYRIKITKMHESNYKDISLLYEGIAKILYNRAMQ